MVIQRISIRRRVKGTNNNIRAEEEEEQTINQECEEGDKEEHNWKRR